MSSALLGRIMQPPKSSFGTENEVAGHITLLISGPTFLKFDLAFNILCSFHILAPRPVVISVAKRCISLTTKCLLTTNLERRQLSSIRRYCVKSFCIIKPRKRL